MNTGHEIREMLKDAGLLEECGPAKTAALVWLVEWCMRRNLTRLEALLVVKELKTRDRFGIDGPATVSLLWDVNRWGPALVYSKSNTMFVPAINRWVPLDVQPVMIDTLDMQRLEGKLRKADEPAEEHNQGSDQP